MMDRTLKLTQTDQRTLAIFYCLYGHKPFLWHTRGKFQWYFEDTLRTRNRLIKMGLVTCYQIYYQDHWLAVVDVCPLSDACQFDDNLISKTIEQELEQNPHLRRLQSQSEPYIINEPETLSFANSAYTTDFASLLERLPTRSSYLRSLDHGKIRNRAQYWPESAVQVAMQSLTLSAEWASN